MNVKLHRYIPILAASATLLALSGCTGEKAGNVSERTGDPQSPPAYQDALTSYSFERRDEFVSQFNAMYSEFSAQLREYEAKKPSADAAENDATAMLEVKSAEADFKNKLSALSSADEASWNTARDNVTAAWDRLQAAFARANTTGVIPSSGL